MRSDFFLNNESKKQSKNDKKKRAITKYACQKKTDEGHSIVRVRYIVPTASHPIPFSDRNHVPKRMASTP